MKNKLERHLSAALTAVSFLIVILLMAALVLEFGLWTRSAHLAGPFSGEEHLFIADLSALLPPVGIFDTGGDTENRPERSSLHFAVGGTPWTKAHVLHADLRAGAKLSFSHWGNQIYFARDESAALPSRIDVIYEIHVRPILLKFLWLLTFFVVGLRAALAIRTGSGLKLMGRLVRVWMRVSIWLSWCCLAAAILYFASILLALALGYALPTAAIFKWIPGGDALDRAMPFAAFPIVIVCAVGGLCGWASWFGAIKTYEYQELEKRIIRFWSFAAFPIIAAFLLLATSAGGWNGRYEPAQLPYQSVSGLVPFSDAQAYYFSTFDLLNTGSWNTVAAQRPMAAAMRGILTVGGGFSYVGTLIVQTLLLAGLLCFALRSFVAWQGIWVAGAFLALAYGLMQPYLTTTLTEPLGLAWSLLSLAFFIEALRCRSMPHALVGFAALCLGLMTRMGSMFTIPFLMIWIVFAFARTWRDRLQLAGMVSSILLLIFVFNTGMISKFAPANSELGGNFSYAACGLARGTNWSECATTFSKEINATTDAKQKNGFLYKQAAEAFSKNPSALFYKLSENSMGYVLNIPFILLEQYQHITFLSISQALAFVAFCALGLIVVTGNNLFVASFWLTVFVSTVVSASLIFGDDGRRTLQVTYAFLAALFALGFASPAAARRLDNTIVASWRRGAGAIALTLMAFAGATFAMQLHFSIAGNREASTNDSYHIGVLGAPSLAGFLVIPDGSAQTSSMPTIEFSVFRTMFEGSLLLSDIGPVIDVTAEHLPFVFFAAPRSEGQRAGRAITYLYVGSPQILENRQADRWAFDLSPIGNTGKFFFVRKEVASTR